MQNDLTPFFNQVVGEESKGVYMPVKVTPVD